MNNAVPNRAQEASALKPCVVHDTNAYVVETTGASVTTDTSVNFIQQYCERLPRDTFFTPKPTFQYVLVGDLYQCKLSLPTNAAFQTIMGPESRKAHVSKQLVCLEACKKLHKVGALNDHLVPYNGESLESDHVNNKLSTSGAGTTKRKELHGMTPARLLRGTWENKHAEASFWAYKMDFSCNIPEQRYSSFVLLIELQLDDDVGNLELDL